MRYNERALSEEKGFEHFSPRDPESGSPDFHLKSS